MNERESASFQERVENAIAAKNSDEVSTISNPNNPQEETFFGDSDPDEPIDNNELESKINTENAFNINNLGEELRKEICELIIKAADNYKSTSTVYAPPGGIVDKNSIKENAEWYLYIDTISADEIASSKEKINSRSVIKDFIESCDPNISVLQINNTSSHSEMFRIEDKRTFLNLPRVIFLIHSENINKFLDLAEKLRKQAELAKTIPTYQQDNSVIKQPEGNNNSELDKPQSISVQVSPKLPVTLENLIDENSLLALQVFLPFFRKEQTKEGRDDRLKSFEETLDDPELNVQANNLNQLAWLQPVIDILTVLDSYIALFNYEEVEIHTFEFVICSILKCLNAILECLNALKSDNTKVKVLEIPSLFAELNKLINDAENVAGNVMRTSFTKNEKRRASTNKPRIIQVFSLPSQKAKYKAYDKMASVRVTDFYTLKLAQYGLYAVAVLAAITSIVVGLLVTLPYVAIPVAITLLALVIAEAARRQKNDVPEKIDTITAAMSSMPRTFSDYINAEFKPAIWLNGSV